MNMIFSIMMESIAISIMGGGLDSVQEKSAERLTPSAWTATVIHHQSDRGDRTYRVWGQGNQWRREEVVEGAEGSGDAKPMVCDGEQFWAYDKLAKGYRPDRTLYPAVWEMEMVPDEDFHKMVEVGQETIEGHPCVILSLTQTIKGRNVKTGRPSTASLTTRVWLWKEMGIRLRKETVGGDYLSLTDVRGWTPLSGDHSSLFSLPPDAVRLDPVVYDDNLDVPKEVKALVGQSLKDTVLPQVGTTVSHTLSSHRGHVMVLNFFTTWCGPCQIEMPVLVKTYHTYQPKGVVFLSIDGGPEKESWVQTFMTKHQVTWPVLLDTQAFHNAYAPAYPVTLVIDAQGMIRASHVGAVTEAWLRQKLDKLLVSGAPPARNKNN